MSPLDASRLEADARVGVDRACGDFCATHPDSPSPDLDRRVQQPRRVDARREAAFERIAVGLVQEQRASRPRDDLRELRRNQRHRVGHAEAGAHRLRDLVERVNLAVRQRDVLERVGRAAGTRPAGGAMPVAIALRRRSRRLPCSSWPNSAISAGSISMNDRHQLRIERASGFVPQQADRAVVAERLVIRPLGRHRVVVVDDRQDARADRNVLAGQPLRIALAVPPLVVAQDQRRHRVGERHGGDDLRADLRVDADLLELFLRERSRLRQDVLGHGELADVVQQRGCLDALDLALGSPRPSARPAAYTCTRRMCICVV